MSRSGYHDDLDDLTLGRWRGMVASATRGKRGQQFFRDLLAALDAMPEKVLITSALQDDSGDVCALGALGRQRGVDMSKIDPECPEQVAPAFNIAECLAQEVEYMNDEYHERPYDPKIMDYRKITPEERWQKMRAWVVSQIRVTPDECLALNQAPKS